MKNGRGKKRQGAGLFSHGTATKPRSREVFPLFSSGIIAATAILVSCQAALAASPVDARRDLKISALSLVDLGYQLSRTFLVRVNTERDVPSVNLPNPQFVLSLTNVTAVEALTQFVAEYPAFAWESNSETGSFTLYPRDARPTILDWRIDRLTIKDRTARWIFEQDDLLGLASHRVEPVAMWRGFPPDWYFSNRVSLELTNLLAKEAIEKICAQLRTVRWDLNPDGYGSNYVLRLSSVPIIELPNRQPPAQPDRPPLVLGRVAATEEASRLIAPATSPEYELEGKIEQSFLDAKAPAAARQGEFKVFVKGCQWLIQTVETKPGALIEKHEAGSEDGTEVFSIMTPLNADVPDMRFATIQSSGAPVDTVAGSVIGHLWLMFASHSHLNNVEINRLTPVYDPESSRLGSPRLAHQAQWVLNPGPGSLPAQVVFVQESSFKDFVFQDGPLKGVDLKGSILDVVFTNAIYRNKGLTNVSGYAFPIGFVFEQGGAQVWRRAEAVVTEVRTNCNLTRFLPEITGPTIVVDSRTTQSPQPNTYRTSKATGWRNPAGSREEPEPK